MTRCRLELLATVVAAGLAWGGRALAQEASPAPAPGPEAQAAQDPRMTEARERIGRGETLFEAGDFNGAMVEFQRARELLEGHPMQYLVDYNIGRCYERQFQYDQAMTFYRAYLEHAGPDAADAGDVRTRIEMLEGLLGTIRLQVNVTGYEVWIDERSYGTDRASVLVPGGTHVVEVRAAGYESGRQEVTVPARTEQTLTFALEQLAEEYRGLHMAYFITATALSVVTVAVGAAFGGMAMSESGDLEDQLADPVQGWLVTQDDLDHVSTLAMTADILYGTAALFAVGAIVLGVFTNWGRHGEGETPAAAGAAASRLRFSPMLGRDGGGLTLGGVF
jgi:tetratricopeptide (TPR) repeat protein